MQVHRTSVVRALSGFGEDLATLGATRSTRYVMRRSVRHVGCRWPIFRIDAHGHAREWAELEAFHNRSWRVAWAGQSPDWLAHFVGRNGLWDGFPFFLSDVRPQGFLGRLIAARLGPLIGLPDDPRRWSDEDIVVFLQAAGSDVPGDLVVGEAMLKCALEAKVNSPSGHEIDEADYPSYAKAIANQLPGSSAGGEQPKFAARLRCGEQTREVLVKFSAPFASEVGLRWADLLVCEFHAREVLAGVGLSNPGARLIDAEGRRFLEVPRFDRTDGGGRLGVVSMEAVAASSIGFQPDWSTAAAMLGSIGLIDDAALDTVRVLQSFGEWIGNTDMHSGNLAFFLGDTLPLTPTPADDMLPMLWAPGPQGELVDREFSPAQPMPAMADASSRAVGLAVDFWQRVVGDSRVSPGFVAMAGRAGDRVRRMRGHM